MTKIITITKTDSGWDVEFDWLWLLLIVMAIAAN